jgi:transcriptional regulator with XRE-family HTH domain
MNTVSTRRSAKSRKPKAQGDLASNIAPLVSIARQLRGWADTVIGMAGPAADMALGLAKAQVKSPQQKSVIGKAGSLLRRMRESAGLTLDELAHAVDLRDPDLIAQAERGVVALPFELILRVAGVVGRGDPLTSMMRLTRAYNPDLWKALEDLGLGRLVVQAGRERELANVYRGNDAARRLPDEDFATVLAFTKQAFDMAVAFRKQKAPSSKSRATAQGEP